MKLKFRATPKDITAFGIFAAVLLFLIAVLIANIDSFRNYGEFVGFNPLPAFTLNNLPVTMVLFLSIIIIILLSVTSSIFNREKGIGFEVKDKADKGYSRWLKEKEMKKELKMVHPSDESSLYGGIPLINNGKEIWVDDSEYHNLIIGSTGSGKTEMLVQPMVKCLAKSNQSMIITDPKGEIYERNANELRERGYKIVLLNFRDPQKGNCWNPLSLPYSLYKEGNSDKANELLDDLAMNILYDESSQNQDPFWEKTSADYFAGLSLALFDDAEESQINLNSINLMTTAGEEKFRNTTYMKEYFSYKDEASPAYVNVSKIRGYGDYNDERYKELNYYNDSREIPIGDYKYLVEVEMDQSFTEGIDVEHLSYSMFSLVDGIEDGIKVFLEKTMKAQKVEEKNIHFKDSSSYYIKSLDLVYDEESYKILSINMEGYLLKH